MNRRGFLKAGLAASAVSILDWRLLAAKEGLPSYYGDYLAGIVEKVRARAAKGRDAFWFITDPHVPANRRMSGRILAKLVRETGVAKVFCGGDIPGAYGTRQDVEEVMATFRREWIEIIEAAGGKFYLAKGNHDFTIRKGRTQEGWTLDGRAAREYILGTAAARSVVSNSDDPEAAYYYIDNPDARVRYVVADTTDTIAASRAYWAVECGVHKRQFEWLRDVAFGTLPKDYSCVVIHHIPITGVVGDEYAERVFANLRGLVNEHAERVVLDLTGHMHCEMQTCQHGIWHVTEPCDAAYGDYINRSRPWCPDLPRKNAGTVFENTFDAVVLGADGHRIEFIRVGGGADRVLVRDVAEVRVGEERQFTSALDGIRWGCYDADRVSFKTEQDGKRSQLPEYHDDVATIDARGVLTGRKPGECVVVALASDGRKEMFPARIVYEG